MENKNDLTQITKLIESRRSTRSFLSKSPDRKTVLKIINAGIWAPSACNRQGWRFLVLTKNSVRRLADLGGPAFFKNTPLAILILYEKATDNAEYKDGLLSAAAAIQNMLLAATAMGLGTCWVANLPPKKKIRKLFSISSDFDPVSLIALGYPAVISPVIKRRHSSRELTDFDVFNTNLTLTANAPARLLIRKALRILYWRAPVRIRKAVGPVASRFERKEFHAEKY